MTTESEINNSLPVLCGVIGNPIEHSLSPKIHSSFANQTQVNLQYNKYLLTKDDVEPFIKEFFAKGGKAGVGLNVTLPFKQQVIGIADQLTEASKVCQSVNTLSLDQNGNIIGDTTDGEGLFLDLERLGYQVRNRNILVIGAGGASLSVIYALLSNQSNVTLNNRSQEKIHSVISQFSSIGTIENFDSKTDKQFDGVIVAISEFNQILLEATIPFLKKDAFIYDLNYSDRAEETLSYFKSKGFDRVSDGYGMLVGQAAKSFEIWHGVLPCIKV